MAGGGAAITRVAAPAGLRWREPAPLTAELALARSRPLFYLVGVLWNGAFALVGATSSAPKAKNIIPFALAFSALFVVVFVRSLLVRSELRFDASRFVVRTKPFGGTAFSVPLSEIERFEARHSEEENRNDVFCVLRAGGGEQRVPVDLEPVRIGMRGSRRAFWSSPTAHADFVASRLGAMLAEARLLGHDTYRT